MSFSLFSRNYHFNDRKGCDWRLVKDRNTEDNTSICCSPSAFKGVFVSSLQPLRISEGMSC